jgi:hypothetical protein
MPLHYGEVFLDDLQLIALFNEELATRVLAAREGVSTQSLERAWQALRKDGHLPKDPRSSHSHSTAHGHYDHDYDGRPSVDQQDDDPLLTRLRRFHTVVDAKK